MLRKNLLNDLQGMIKPTNGDHKQERLGNYYSKKAIFALLNESIVQFCYKTMNKNIQKIINKKSLLKRIHEKSFTATNFQQI